MALPIMSGDESQVLYSLYGVVEHSGQLNSGHYTAFVKLRPNNPHSPSFLNTLPQYLCNVKRLTQQLRGHVDRGASEASAAPEPVPGQWYHISDTYVRKVSQQQVLNAVAYILFYERIS